MRVLHKIIILLSLLTGATVMADNAYDFSFQKIDGSGELKLSSYKGKIIMVVNTASFCGFTKQYADLEKLYKQYKDKGFEIIAVPSNDFGKQEPGPNAEIQNFCEVNFNISFPITEKVDVKGKESHPFFIWTRGNFGGLSGPKWNFYKYIIGKDGEILEWFSSMTSPTSKKIIKLIEENL
jgi:glutathione peroxidase